MRAEPVANALGPVGFLAAVWLGLFRGAPEDGLWWRGAVVGAAMWAAGWCAGRAGRAVLRDAAGRIGAREEAEKKAAAEGVPSRTSATGVPSGPSVASPAQAAVSTTAARRT